MRDQLHFDYRSISYLGPKPLVSRQLTIAVSPVLYDATAHENPWLQGEVDALTGGGDRAGYGVVEIVDEEDVFGNHYAFAVRDATIGGITDLVERHRQMTAVNRLISAFVAANAKSEGYHLSGRVPAGSVHLISYDPSPALGSNEFYFSAMLGIPDMNEIKIGEIAKRQMRTAAATLKYIGGRSLSAIDVRVNTHRGVHFSLNADANVGTPDEDFVPGDKSVWLTGNNVDGPFGSYVILQALVAAAKAKQLQGRR